MSDDGMWRNDRGIYLGYACNNTQGAPEELSDKPLQYVGDRHIVTFGPNGSGKSRRLLWTNLIGLPNWSCLVVDPKGELARDTAAFRAERGKNNVILLNPFNTLDLGSDTYNPVAVLDPSAEDFIDDAMGLAECLIQVGGNDPHWGESAQDLLCALIMYSRLTQPGGGSLGHVRAMLGQTADEFVADVRKMREIGVVEDCEELTIKAARFADLTAENEELNSILSTALTQTRWLDSRPIKQNLASGAFDFGRMKEERITLYLILPANRMGTHGRWLRLIITSVIQCLMKDTRQPRFPVLLMLDEFAALGHLPIIQNTMAMMRGYGVKLWAVWQDLPQAKDIYRDRWESFIANAGVLQAFAPQDMTTAEFLSARAMQRTEDVLGYSSGIDGATGRLASASSSLNVQSLPRMSPEALINMDMGYSILFTHKTKGPVYSWLSDPSDMPGYANVIEPAP